MTRADIDPVRAGNLFIMEPMTIVKAERSR